jgi:hypothetical protein
MLIMGALFIIVVLFLPNGLISLLDPLFRRRLQRPTKVGTEPLPVTAPSAMNSITSLPLPTAAMDQNEPAQQQRAAR